jgi:predicted GNAT family N-acyltransferase
MASPHLRIGPASSDIWPAAKAIRQRVFVEEQACPPEEEWDEWDATATHLLAEVDGQPVATARFRGYELGGRPFAKLERFAVVPEHRGSGLGRWIVRATMEAARTAGFERFVLHAQAHLEAFYGGLGFRRVGDVFWEAGIEHVKMIRAED